MNRITIIPTGDEILDGTVRDLDSPMVLSELLRLWPQACAVRAAPAADSLPAILAAMEAAQAEGTDLAILIGGSGADSFAEAAEKAGTISYELLCAVSRRVPRVYLRGGGVTAVEDYLAEN